MNRHVPAHEFFLPVHGFVRLTDAEVEVVNHPAFQRLGLIYQLGQAHLVYRGATHKRLEHALGSLYIAQKMLHAIAENHSLAERALASGIAPRAYPSDALLAEPPTDLERFFIRLAALLHDIGHLPAGHTLEDELSLLDKHDGAARLQLILDRTAWPGGEVSSLRSVIDREYGDFVVDGVTASELLIGIVAKRESSAESVRLPSSMHIRVDMCRDIVGDTICADLLDYLHRDWYHIGKVRELDERILQYMEIRTERSKGAGSIDYFVISLGRRPKIRTDAVSAILGLLESRYGLAESVLFHRTKCAAAAMLERGIRELELQVPESDRAKWRRELTEQLLDVSDEGAVALLLDRAKRLGNAQAAVTPLQALAVRRLYRGVSTTFRDDVPGDIASRLFRMYTESTNAAAERHRAVSMLERDFGLPGGSVTMYCPDKRMNAKVARVRIHIDGEIAPFNDWESQNDQQLSGGHLDAQTRRFERLWRVHVFVARDVWDKMSHRKRTLLLEGIDALIIGNTRAAGQLDDRAQALAELSVDVDDMPRLGQVADGALVGARGEKAEYYPSGAPTLRSFFPPEAAKG